MSKSKRLIVIAAFVVVVAAAMVAMFAGSSSEPDHDVALAVSDAGVDVLPAAPTAEQAEPPEVAPAAASAARAIPPGRGRLHIDVVDRGGRAIVRASVHVIAGFTAHGPPASAPRDRMVFDGIDDGRGVDADVVAGNAMIEVSAPRFHPTRYDDAVVREGRVTNARIALDASNALRGTVRDRVTRAPIAAAKVEGIFTVDGDLRTDASGHFDVDTLPNGRITLTISATGYRALTLGGIRGDRSRDEVVDAELEPLSDGGPAQEFVGIGFLMEGRDHWQKPYVADIYPDTPASAVLKVGDDILDIDGVDVSNAYVEYARGLMLGDVDTSVRIGVMRDGQRLQFDITRARLPVLARKRPSGG